MTSRRRWFRRHGTHPAVRAVAFLLLGLQLAGCASSEAPKAVVWQVAESDRRAIRDVAVAPADLALDVKLALPAKGAGEGAGRGAALGASAPIAAGGYAGGGYGAVVGVLLAPFTAVIGAGVGAQAAPPAEQVEADEKIVRQAFTEPDLHARLADSVGARVAAETGRRIAATIRGPSASDKSPDYGGAVAADAIVEVRITKAALEGPWSINPPIRFVLEARARLIRTPGDRLLWDRPLIYEGAAMELAEWAKDDAARLKAQIDRAMAAVAERIVDDMFLLYVPPVWTAKTEDGV